jgi:heme exporter protein A|tara:strand:- start:300 stop:929 length:630 start_codon:yes stop_codon:yes gene_type:complete
VLSLINVTKRFGYRTVLNRACLEIKQGEAVGLLGKNGSGKSTLLRIVSRILSYDFGSILWNGKPLMSSKLDSRRFLLYLGHEPGLYPPLSALENLQLVANIYGEDSSRKRIEKHLEAVGVDYSREGPIREFSRGMLQRLSLAKASIISWKLLLLDEPTTGLDSDGIELLSYMVESWKKEGRSLLVVSHDKLWISKYMDRVVVLENGEIN